MSDTVLTFENQLPRGTMEWTVLKFGRCEFKVYSCTFFDLNLKEIIIYHFLVMLLLFLIFFWGELSGVRQS